jgi:hypothetical protein
MRSSYHPITKVQGVERATNVGKWEAPDCFLVHLPVVVRVGLRVGTDCRTANSAERDANFVNIAG